MSIKDVLLQKGWAGKTISRSETAQRVNALIRPLVELLHVYNAFLSESSGTDLGELQQCLPVLRADIGKLAETVHSCGATAYSGIDLDSTRYSGALSQVEAILERENAYASLLRDEGRVEHQMRTRAILDALAANSARRSALLRSVAGVGTR